ncbi:ribonuclease III domain protein [Medicago truncatula]|uniref:Ribonuclease III domain protein n=1 Tax=Medicago truncatula TaxID=3880 RepID=G7IIM7_MEDTR|nr:ribonuclease III domain protein [Medicago truncatula]
MTRKNYLLNKKKKTTTPSTTNFSALLNEVEALIGYEFKNKHLLEEAFTHFFFFFSYLNLKPGILTPLRSKNADSEKLACVAIKHGLDRYLQHKKPQLGEHGKVAPSGIQLVWTNHLRVNSPAGHNIERSNENSFLVSHLIH